MTDGLEYLGRARLQGLTLLLLVFVVGVLAGFAGDRLLTRPRTPEPRPQDSRERPRLPKVLEDMDLTALQRTTIDSIIASGRPRNEAIMNEVLPKLRAVGDTLHQAIRAVLTPRQAAEFDAYLKTHRPQTPPPPRDDLERPPRRDAQPGESPGDRSRDRRPPPREPGDRRPPPPPGDRPPPPGGEPPPPPGGGPGRR